MSLKYNKIYNIDCLDGMKMIDDNSVDLIIADPPYGVSYQSNFRKDKFDTLKNDSVILSEWISEAFRILKEGGAIYCYTRWDVYPEWYNLIAEHFKIKNTIIWFKKGGGLGDLKGGYIYNHEFIIFASKGRHILNGKRLNDVWEVPKDPPSQYIHPTQKPVDLSRQIITKSSNEQDLIVVPFVGSGSEIISCIGTKRNYIGFELDKNYYDKSQDRINEYILKTQ